MSTVYLIRHGQAGSMQAYDQLSKLGVRQSELLGEFFASRQLAFDAVYSGTLRRQRETATATLAAAGRRQAVVEDSLWDEFDLTRVYEEIAPRIGEADEVFRLQYAEKLRLAEDPNHSVHRRWSDCDVQVVRAWIEGRYPTECESWAAFKQRVWSTFERISEHAEDTTIAVFTSATPIAVWAGMALETPDHKIMRLAGVMYNSAFTTIKMRQRDFALTSFNNAPHLQAPELRTYR